MSISVICLSVCQVGNHTNGHYITFTKTWTWVSHWWTLQTFVILGITLIDITYHSQIFHFKLQRSSFRSANVCLSVCVWSIRNSWRFQKVQGSSMEGSVKVQDHKNSQCLSILIILYIFRYRIPDVTERLRRDSEGRTLSSNLVFTIWAVFGGFILHFLLCNYLTVLLRPRYEEPVETAADIINRDITPFYSPFGQIMREFLAASPDPNYQEISRRMVISNNWTEYYGMFDKVITTGLFAQIATVPTVPEEEHKKWYRSTETIVGFFPYGVHLTNKKWPLKKVFYYCASVHANSQ